MPLRRLLLLSVDSFALRLLRAALRAADAAFAAILMFHC